MRAILLVAGVGRRLGNASVPKCMLEFGGRTLLARHVDALEAARCSHLTVVVGHLQEHIRRELDRLRGDGLHMALTIRENPDYREGSVVSLHGSREDLSSTESTLVMDGDVLYDSALLRRLRQGGGASAFLLDRRSHETGEEMMIGVRGGRALRIARRVGTGDDDGPWDMVGEGVGFMKIGPAHAAPMREMLEAHVASGARNTEYEAVYDKFLKHHEVGVVEVSGAPWTEIDFEDDVVRARDVVLPEIVRRSEETLR